MLIKGSFQNLTSAARPKLLRTFKPLGIKASAMTILLSFFVSKRFVGTLLKTIMLLRLSKCSCKRYWQS